MTSNASFVQITSRLCAGGSERAKDLFYGSSPRMPQVHLFDTNDGTHLLVSDGSRIYKVSGSVQDSLTQAIETLDSALVDKILSEHGLNSLTYVDDEPLADPPLNSLSLAIAQKCNLGCTYCYAQEGGFGGQPQDMSIEVAMASVKVLLSQAQAGQRINIAFLGGEPLTNREVLRAVTKKAFLLAASKGVEATFSITTNGTLLIPDDGDFFEQYGFAVTISVDGIGEVHDRLRPFKGGQSSYERIINNAIPLLSKQNRMQVSARVTVTPGNLYLPETLEELIGYGFHSIGFSPMLSSPTGREELNELELEIMLDQMVTCGKRFEASIIAGKRYPFANMVNAMREIHKGTHRPYPCGAGAGYLGVSAEGNLFACHRFVDDEAGAMGNITDGINREQQREWLESRFVNHQEPCRRCWARYLCGGGCHHEVIHRGRPACNYIRGWLHYCLQAYVHLSEKQPDYFHSGLNV